MNGRMTALALVAVDIVALVLAWFASAWVTVFLELNVFDKPAFYIFPEVAQTRETIIFILGMVIIALFCAKNFYTRRMPWWSQVQYILKTVLFAFILDGFINFGLQLYQSRLLIVTGWAFAALFLVSFRWVFFFAAGRMG